MKRHSHLARGLRISLCLIILCLTSLFTYASAADSKAVELTVKTSLINGKAIVLEISDESGTPISLQDITPDYGTSSATELKCGIYSAAVSAGSLSYVAYDPTTNAKLGAGVFYVPSNSNEQEVFLSSYDFGGNNSQYPTIKNTDNIDYSLKITGPDGVTSYSVGDNGTTAVLPTNMGEHDSAYTYEFIPANDEYWGSSGELWVYELGATDYFGGLNLSDSQQEGFLIAPKKTIRIQVEKGATIRLSRIVRFYRPFEYIYGTLISSDETTDTYEFVVPDATLRYEVRKEGKITKAAYVTVSQYSDGEDILQVPELKDDSEGFVRKLDDFAASILLNGPSSKMLALNVGENFDIVAFRAWQAVSSVTGNNYMDPDYHYTLISGDSIRLRDDGRITAVKPGVSVIQVTYDALEWPSVVSVDGKKEPMIYSSIWPERTGVYVVNVGDDNSSNIQTNIALTEYDTIYYAKTIAGESKDSYAEYSFTPTADASLTVRVQKPLTTDWNDGWQEYTPDSSGQYTIKLYDGPNIVEVKAGSSAQYHVIYASGLDIRFENLYTDREEWYVGDTVRIHFDGLIIPIPKLGAVYNPGFGKTIYVTYELNGELVEGVRGQYSIRTDNAITLELTEDGTFELKNGTIHAQSYGSVQTAHQVITKESKVSTYRGELAGETIVDSFCSLPDISYTVVSAENLEEQALNYIQITTTIKPAPVMASSQGNPMLGYSTKSTNYFCRLHCGSSTNTPTVVNDRDLLPQNLVAWNVTQILKAEASDVYLRVKPDVEDVTMQLRYWSTADGHTKVATIPVAYNTNTTIPAFASASDAAWFELIVTPNEGVNAYPKTYTFLANSSSGNYYGKLAYLYGLELTALDGQKDMKITDGLLHAVDDGEIDFGYGFLGTQTAYNVNVPSSTTQITLTPTALVENNTVTITVNGQETDNQSPSAVIDLQEGENSISVTVSVSDENNTIDTTTYTIDVNRAAEDKAKKVEALIAKIGEVSLDGKEVIDAARSAYNELSEEDKLRVGNLDILLAAEEMLAQLESAAVKSVVELIQDIFPVNLDAKDRIIAARNLYERLPDYLKTQVTNYDVLLQAEADYAALEQPEAPKGDDEVTVTLNVSYGDDIYAPEFTGEPIAQTTLTVPYFDLAQYGLETYYYNPDCYQSVQTGGTSDSAEGKVTLLHALIYATEVLYEGIDENEAGQGWLYEEKLMSEVFNPTGGAGSLYFNPLWNFGYNLNYYVNYEYPIGREGFGATADQILLADGDVVSLHGISEGSAATGTVFSYFRLNGERDHATLAQGNTAILRLYHTKAASNFNSTIYTVGTKEKVYITSVLTEDISEWTEVGTTDGAGALSLDTSELDIGTYYIATAGFNGTYQTAPAVFVLTVTENVDKVAADKVIALIDAIGEVTLDSKDAIEAAENAYNVLTEEQKKLVGNYQKLLDARTAYDKLAEDAEKPVIPDIPVVPGTPTTPSKPSTPAVPEAPSFTDIGGHWATDAIEYAVANGLMNGTGNGLFSPNANTTRGMIVTILARLEGVDTSKGGNWYEAGQQWAMKLGISDGTNMDGQITREQLATMLYRYAQLKGYDVSTSASLNAFTDASSVSDWAVEAMQWAVGTGLMEGNNNQLSPTAPATRAQVATLLMRFIEKLAK